MSTPALDRAKRELGNEWTNEQAQTIARDVVYAALHDPDDPEGLWLYGAAIDAAAASLGTTLLTESYIVAVRAAVDAVRAAILGEAGRRRDTAEPGERRRKPPEPMPTKTRIIQGFGI